MTSDLRLGGPGDDACTSRAAVRHHGFFPTVGSLFWGFFAYVFFVFFLLFLQSQPACVWIKFYGNICWLSARSALFL
jgi:hypothetical protein